MWISIYAHYSETRPQIESPFLENNWIETNDFTSEETIQRLLAKPNKGYPEEHLRLCLKNPFSWQTENYLIEPLQKINKIPILKPLTIRSKTPINSVPPIKKISNLLF